MDEFQPNSHFLITDLETLRVLTHSLRAQLLDQFGEGAMTVKQVAGRMGLVPNKLYYHVNMLEEHGLIRVVQVVIRPVSRRASICCLGKSAISFVAHLIPSVIPQQLCAWTMGRESLRCKPCWGIARSQ